MRTAEEIKMRCKLILDQPKIVLLINKSNSPTAAYEMVFAETKDILKAKAGRWLAVLRRDYPEEFSQLIQSLNSRANNGMGNQKETLL